MADDTLSVFFAHADALAQRIRERYEYQLTQEIAAKERTIDIQIDQASEEKADRLATQKLEKLQAWIEASKKRSLLMDKFKSDLFWIGNWISTGNKSIILYLLGIGIYTTIGFWWGINAPTSIACPKMQSACYFWRWDKTRVVLPQQAKQLIEEYEKLKTKPKAKSSPRYRRK